MLSALTLIVFAAAVGVCAGSLVNAFVLRTKHGIPLMSRSKCARCVEPIAWFDAIPVLSYVALRGRCRRCTAAIEWQYPAVEIAIGVLFAVFAARILFGLGMPDFVSTYPGHGEQWLLFARDAAIGMILVIIFLYDFRFSVIPDKFSFTGIGVALVANIVLGASALETLLGGLVIGAFFAMQFLVSQGRWIGGGDIRMGLLMGFLLGLPLGMLALFLAYIGGAIAGIVLLATKQRALDSHVPFGTFLAGATVIAMLFGPMMLEWYLGYFV